MNGWASALAQGLDNPRSRPPTWEYVDSLIERMAQLKADNAISKIDADAFRRILECTGYSESMPFWKRVVCERKRKPKDFQKIMAEIIAGEIAGSDRRRKQGAEVNRERAIRRAEIAQGIAGDMKQNGQEVTARTVHVEIQLRHRTGIGAVRRHFSRDQNYDGTTERTISGYLRPASKRKPL